MKAECKSYRLEIDADARLAAAAGGLAHFLGDAAGLSSEAASELQKSVVAACGELFESSGDALRLTVTFSWYVDRIEVALTQKGSGGPAVDLDRIAGVVGGRGGSDTAIAGVDRVQFETKDGAAVTRLTKYLRDAPRVA